MIEEVMEHILVLVVYAGCALLFVKTLVSAAVGYEDRHGFHYGKPLTNK